MMSADMRLYGMVILSVLLAGCTVYRVDPIGYDDSLHFVYVLKNQNMRVDGFEELLCHRFNESGIATRPVNAKESIPRDAFWVSYTGLWSWDLTLYLAHAEVDVFKGGQQIGHGYYHHRGTNLSLAPSKFRSAKTKMTPLYDELLQNYEGKIRPVSEP